MEEDSFEYMISGILVYHGEKSMAEQSPTHDHRQDRVRQGQGTVSNLSPPGDPLPSAGFSLPSQFPDLPNSDTCWMTSSQHSWDSCYSNHNISVLHRWEQFCQESQGVLYQMTFLRQTSESKPVLFKKRQDNTRIQHQSSKYSDSPQFRVQKEPEID